MSALTIHKMRSFFSLDTSHLTIEAQIELEKARVQELLAWSATIGDEKYFEMMEKFEDEPLFIQSRLREVFTRKYSWAVPCPGALNTIAKYAPIIEIGAGTGYWAWLLRRQGVDILAYDAKPPDRKSTNGWGHTRTWTNVLPGRANKAKKHPDRSLMLCWPPRISDHPRSKSLARSCPAYNSLRQYRGRHVIFIGAFSSLTGSQAFFDLLEHDFERIDKCSIPNWYGIHDYLTVHERKVVR
jgi:hypothetical protein